GILVWSGASSAGRTTIQLARLAGLRVFASASPRHHAGLLALGAAEVVDYRSPSAVSDLVAAAERAGGVEIRYAVDPISTDETLPLVLDVLSRANKRTGNGNGTAKLAHLGRWPERVALPEGIEAVFVRGTAIWTERRDLAAGVFNELLSAWLEAGDVVPQTVRVVEGGLDGLQTALNGLRKGVSGEKLVVEL
ncbi:hypothetical protein N658DRAFT_422982, partial [Parathielavia hyrcaniae]